MPAYDLVSALKRHVDSNSSAHARYEWNWYIKLYEALKQVFVFVDVSSEAMAGQTSQTSANTLYLLR